MIRKIVAVWVSLAMLLGFIVVVDVVTDIVPSVSAATITVDDSGGAMYTKIQDAINASNDGDTVYVYSGIYYENVVVNKTINLTGEDRDTTIIDGSLNGDVVNISADWVNLSGFSVINSDNWPHAGIYCYKVHNCNISGNNVLSNDGDGIYLYSSSNNSIIGNNVSNNNQGIFLDSSSNNNLINGNDVSDNWCGIYLDSSSSNNITGNNLVNDGIFLYGNSLSHFNSHTIPTNNLVNERAVYYYKDCSGIDIEGIPMGQIILANCTNINITNQIINNTHVGIEIAYSTNILATSNNISNNYHGIYFYSSSNNNITGNNASFNTYGIRLDSSSNNSIKDNILLLNSASGILLWESANNNIITGNNASDNDYGIYVTLSLNNTISDNTLLSNAYYSIMLLESSNNFISDNNASYNGFYGINVFRSSNNNIITSNNVLSNDDYGIRIHTSSSNNIVTGNNVISNNIYGIYLRNSLNNRIYHNNILNNVDQAYDNTINGNQWDNGYPSGGTYWSDYVGPDNFKGPNQNIPGSDGIGDTPYIIDADSQDGYPLMQPYKPLENYIILKQGWNLISIPFIQEEQNLTRVLGSIDSCYDAVQWYNNSDSNKPWKHNKIGNPFGNDLSELKESMGFWIHITNPGDTIFLYNGTEPISNQSITLHPGWNMVGYPSLSNRTRDNALNNINFGADVDAVWTFNAATQKWQEIGPSDYFDLGRGYWIHSKVTKVWDVPL
jgi:parallel beta-helix repeat protein